MDTIGKLSDSKTHTPERNPLGDQKMDNILYRVFQKAGPKVSIFYSEFFNKVCRVIHCLQEISALYDLVLKFKIVNYSFQLLNGISPRELWFVYLKFLKQDL